MELEKEINVVICTVMGELGVPGKYVSCRNCGVRVFLSDQSVNQVMKAASETSELAALCFKCGADFMIKNETQLQLTPEQKFRYAELKKRGLA